MPDDIKIDETKIDETKITAKEDLKPVDPLANLDFDAIAEKLSDPLTTMIEEKIAAALAAMKPEEDTTLAQQGTKAVDTPETPTVQEKPTETPKPETQDIKPDAPVATKEEIFENTSKHLLEKYNIKIDDAEDAIAFLILARKYGESDAIKMLRNIPDVIAGKTIKNPQVDVMDGNLDNLIAYTEKYRH